MQPSWLFDTGASNHVTFDPSSLQNVSEYGGPDEIILGNGTNLPISHIGSTHITTPLKPLSLPDILCVPNLKRNLISVAKLCKTNNVSVEFFPSHFLVKDLRTGARLMRGENTDDVYHATISSLHQLNFTTTNKSLDWHHKLGHPSVKVFKTIASSLGLNSKIMSNSNVHCPSCAVNKSHKLPFGQNSFVATKPLQLIYSDVWGPVKESIDHFTYYVIFVDFYSKYVWLYPMRYKSDLAKLFPQFKMLVEKFFNHQIVSLFTDNGGEYLGLLPFLQSNGISHYTTPPHTPEQNGVAERRHRHVVETGLSLLHYAKLPLQYWSHAFQTAVYLINRLPTTILENKSPFQILFHQPPTYSKLKPFGCLCYQWLKPYTNSKLQPRSSPCIFLGYSTSKSAYKCLDLATNRLYHSRHVQFIEDNFPFHHHTHSSNLPTAHDFNPIPSATSNVPSHPPTPPTPSSSPVPTQLPNYPLPRPPIPSLHHSRSPTPNHTPETDLNSPATPNCPDHHSHPPPPLSYPITYSRRPRQPSPPPSPAQQPSSNPLQPSSLTPSPPSHTPTTSHIPPPSPPPPPPKRPHKPNSKYFNSNFVNTTTLHPIPATLEPTTHNQAMKDPKWREAMDQEFNALLHNGTWELVPQTSQKPIGCKWVFRVKRNPDGTIAKYKARLVAKGFLQQFGKDYFETFSPVTKPVTIRTILSIALSQNWPLRQLDVNNAFLHGTLHEEVFMSQPPGFVHPQFPNHICKLRKSLYGLKQAPRAWYMELTQFLLTFGFRKSMADASLFIYTHDSVTCYFMV